MENLLTYGLFALFGMLVALTIWVSILHRKIKKLSGGKTAASLEDIIHETHTLSKELKQSQKDHQLHIQNIRTELSKTIQNVPVIKFDALREMGGMQSFVIGLLDSHKNGVILSSLYTRDRMNVFAKQITKGTSKQTLTEEEKKIINL